MSGGSKWFSIFNHKDWVVHATEVRPSIAAVAHGKPPSCDIVVDKHPQTLLQRLARAGFRDVGVTYLNRLVRMIPKDFLKSEPTTAIEQKRSGIMDSSRLQ